MSWSSLSAGQQALVSGGEKAWNGMSLGARANFGAITNVLGKEGLLLEVKSASMRPDAREMNVVCRAGAEKAFEKSGLCLAKILSASKIPQFSLAAAGMRSLQST
jgi:hypothetical protein